MSNLDRALAEISAIRGQMARATEFRGYGPATLAITGLLALAAAAGQALWLPDPAQHVVLWLGLWVTVAGVSAAIIGFEMVGRSRRIHSGLADDMIRTAVQQFLPAAAAGALITVTLAAFAPQSLPLMAGLWQITFGLGVFASCRFLPNTLAFVGAWYLASGLVALALSGGPTAYSPWLMGIGFGVGQLMVAALLRQANGAGHDGN
jgi:hypothetical protein